MRPEEEKNLLSGGGKEERKPALSVRATFWITLALLAALVVVMALMVMKFDSALAGLFVVLIFVFAVFNRACWKCPACRKHLGRFRRAGKCPHCGEEWNM